SRFFPPEPEPQPLAMFDDPTDTSGGPPRSSDTHPSVGAMPQFGLPALPVANDFAEMPPDVSARYRVHRPWRGWLALAVVLLFVGAAGAVLGIALAGPDVELPSQKTQ